MNYLTDKTLASRFSVTRQSIWRWAREGKFPSPVKIGKATTRWKESDVLDWEAKQTKATGSHS